MFKAKKPELLQGVESQAVLYFLLMSLLQNPYADTNNFYIVQAKKCKT